MMSKSQRLKPLASTTNQLLKFIQKCSALSHPVLNHGKKKRKILFLVIATILSFYYVPCARKYELCMLLEAQPLSRGAELQWPSDTQEYAPFYPDNSLSNMAYNG